MAEPLHPTYLYAQHIIESYHDALSVVPWAAPLIAAAEQHDSLSEFSPPMMPMVPVDRGLKVGIVGAGFGGLFAAMLLQHCGVDYEILEASDRVGGRLYTHKFSEDPWDYYDVGAMRFPNTKLMDPVLKLFDIIRVKRIPYYFTTDDNLLLFNEIRKERKDANIHTAKAFRIPGIGGVYASTGWSKLADVVTKPFVERLVQDAETGGKEGWRFMMKYDQYSSRGYMELTKGAEGSEPGFFPFPRNVVDWMELFNSSTNTYDYGLSDMVLEHLAFSWPGPKRDPEWFCVEDGSSEISKAMQKYLDAHKPLGSITKNTRVTAISYSTNASNNHKVVVTVASAGSTEKKSYAHVITTTTFPCLRTVDLSQARLSFSQRTAIRQLTYGPATKVGIKFKTAWWTDEALMKKYGRKPMEGGQSITDRMSRVVVYPSYGPYKRSTVLIASYAWTSDAQALSSLTLPGSEAELKRVILQDLVEVHGFDKAGGTYLEQQWVEAFPYSWTSDPYTMGAYAHFNAGQYKTFYRTMTMPAGNKRLHFAGEVVSARHAVLSFSWVLGALDASARAVYQVILTSFGKHSKEMKKLQEFWNMPEGWTTAKLFRQVAASEHDEATYMAGDPRI
ncbi:hypothetical protein NM688_g4583 [Phlebia brevispora]|uniref:Uncharacterized protein n=1 Tax=Phlebia brevispora TaxID=194682 RepID=A0ACC1T2G8_9APHY|nr:hypothetical protein NM688_g4583 [Phlebia brevispora]